MSDTSSAAPFPGVQLIAYADRFGGSIAGLHELLTGPFAGLFGGVHVLPFFTPFDGADAGFDPVDHTQVDQRLGGWADVRALTADVPVMADVIVNHVSSASAEFQDVVQHGDASPSADLFLTFGDVFPDGGTEAELAAIRRPRPGLPFTPFTLGDRKRLVWTTFTAQQIDIAVESPSGAAYLGRVLQSLTGGGVRMVRMDAVGYAVKTPGTSCFMTPETFRFIGGVADRARALGASVLVEVHSYYRDQIDIATRVDAVYDFALPPLVLHTLFTGEVEPLLQWIRVRPTNAVTVLDTHDGIGVVDVASDPDDPSRSGLLSPSQIDALVEGIHERSAGSSREATGWAASNVDIYQVNCSFFDAVGADDRRYLLARAVQLFIPGTPQIYYAGLLAGANDVGLLRRTGVGRDINRPYYDRAAIDAALKRTVVQAQLDLIRFRSAHPAFDGVFTAEGGAGRLRLRWMHGEHEALLDIDAHTGTASLIASAASEAPTAWAGLLA